MIMRRPLICLGVTLFVAASAMANEVPVPSQTDALEVRAGQTGGRLAATQPIAMPSLGVDVTRMLLALAIVVGLILVARLVLKRFYNGSVQSSGSKAVQVLNRTVLAPKQQILLLQVGRRVVVVGESNGSLATLAQIDDPDEIAQLIGKLGEERLQRASAFGGLFGRAQKKIAEEPAESGFDDSNAVNPTEEPANQMRSELSGLLDKVKSLRSQIGRD